MRESDDNTGLDRSSHIDHSRDIDRSIVVALLLEQFRSVQREQLAVKILSRIIWFVLSIVTLFAPLEFNRLSVIGIIFISMATASVSLLSLIRTRSLDRSLRESIANLDPQLADYYIRMTYASRERMPVPLTIPTYYEEFIWLATCVGIAFYRYFVFH